MVRKKDLSNKVDIRLYRSETDRVLAGVAGGLGRYLNLDSNVIRVIFILISFYAGLGVLLYIAFWILVPKKGSLKNNPGLTISENLQEFRIRAENLSKGKESKIFWGSIILILGLIFLLDTLTIIDFTDLLRFWPLLLIVIGLAILIRR